MSQRTKLSVKDDLIHRTKVEKEKYLLKRCKKNWAWLKDEYM